MILSPRKDIKRISELVVNRDYLVGRHPPHGAWINGQRSEIRTCSYCNRVSITYFHHGDEPIMLCKLHEGILWNIDQFNPDVCLCGTKLVSDVFSPICGDFCPNEKCEI